MKRIFIFVSMVVTILLHPLSVECMEQKTLDELRRMAAKWGQLPETGEYVDHSVEELQIMGDEIDTTTMENVTQIETAEHMEKQGAISRAWSRGWRSTEGMMEGAAGLFGSLIHNDTLRDWGFESYEDTMREASTYPGTKVTGPLSTLMWSAEKFVENIPNLALTGTTAGVGGIIAGSSKVVGNTVVKKAMCSVLKKSVVNKTQILVVNKTQILKSKKLYQEYLDYQQGKLSFVNLSPNLRKEIKNLKYAKPTTNVRETLKYRAVCSDLNQSNKGDFFWHVDHIHPKSKGGKHHQDNLQILPGPLNMEKSNKWPLTPKQEKRYKGFRLN